MGRLIFILTFICFLTSCGPSDDQKAMKFINAAKASLQAGNYSKAKLEIDSIKTTYPKAFDTRKIGIRLMLDVEKEEQLKGIQFIDSVLEQKQELMNNLIKLNKYKFDKNEEYQDIGTYYAPMQSIERNSNRAYLRFSVDEKGKMVMTSFYYGSFPIEHHTIQVSSKQNGFAETPAGDNLYSSENLGMITERQDFILGKNDGNVIDFIVNNKDIPLYVTYKGKRPYKYRLSNVDIDAAVKLEPLARALSSINELNVLKEEANKKLKFIDSRIEKYKNELADIKE